VCAQDVPRDHAHLVPDCRAVSMPFSPAASFPCTEINEYQQSKTWQYYVSRQAFVSWNEALCKTGNHKDMFVPSTRRSTLGDWHFQWLLLMPGTTCHLVSDPRRPWPHFISNSRPCSLRCPVDNRTLPPFCTV